MISTVLSSARMIRVSGSVTELLLDLRHAVLQVRELGDGHQVGQDARHALS